MNKPPEERAKDVTTVSSAEHTRRDFLYIATGAVGAVGAAAVLVPLIAQMNPDASTIAAGARLVEVIDRPRQATGVLLVSAVTGFPPLLAASVYLGRTPMRPVAFAATCLLGRTIRFVTIALAPQLAGY